MKKLNLILVCFTILFVNSCTKQPIVTNSKIECMEPHNPNDPLEIDCSNGVKGTIIRNLNTSSSCGEWLIYSEEVTGNYLIPVNIKDYSQFAIQGQKVKIYYVTVPSPCNQALGIQIYCMQADISSN